MVTRHAPDSLGQWNESPAPTDYEVSCVPHTVSQFVSYFLSCIIPVSPLSLHFFGLLFLLVPLSSCIIFTYFIYFIVLLTEFHLSLLSDKSYSVKPVAYLI